MDFNKLFNLIGIIAFLAVLRYVLKLITRITETSVISKEGLEILDDPKRKIELREAVDEYHKTGDWSQTKLDTII